LRLKSKILIIAGSDSSGGAGIQADIKTVTSLGSYAMTAITAVTVQNTMGVKSVISIPTNEVKNQIIYSSRDIRPDAIKIGMLHSTEVVEKVAHALKILKVKKIVLDPVMGDIGIGLYVEKDVANFFKKVITKVKYISANFFEWSYLNNKDVKNYSISEIITDLKSFTRKFNSQVLIRSIPKNKKILNIICNKREIFVIETPYINFKERFHGAGDQSTALYAHYIYKKNTTREILENVTNDIYDILLKNKIRSQKRKKRFKAKSLNNL